MSSEAACLRRNRGRQGEAAFNLLSVIICVNPWLILNLSFVSIRVIRR